ncbi:MAG: hypothetical protein A4E63_01459 [Syntrophorhabdus sp. PtaU1.Bin050]|nr:MAG: hypothetical protein A4E63_01459 [Syntrophorhabdus sp. PtaU1.Bin050]
MRKGAILCGCALLVLFAFVSSAFAVEITADMITKEGKIVRNGKIYVKDTKIRMEQGGTPIYSVVRGDKGVIWQINAYEKTYVEAKLTPELKPFVEEKLPGEVSRKPLGTEAIDGHPTKKYEVTIKRGKATETYHQWFATDIKFPVKMVNVNGKWSREYKNIKKGAADSLFDLPKGAEKDLTSAPDVLGGGGH